MGWILSRIRVVNIGVIICLLVPFFVLTSYAAEEDPEAVIQHFYKAAREGTYAEAKTHLSRESQEFIKVELYKWTAIVDTLTKNGTLQAVEVGEVTTFSPNYLGGGRHNVQLGDDFRRWKISKNKDRAHQGRGRMEDFFGSANLKWSRLTRTTSSAFTAIGPPLIPL